MCVCFFPCYILFYILMNFIFINTENLKKKNEFFQHDNTILVYLSTVYECKQGILFKCFIDWKKKWKKKHLFFCLFIFTTCTLHPLALFQFWFPLNSLPHFPLGSTLLTATIQREISVTYFVFIHFKNLSYHYSLFFHYHTPNTRSL